MSIRIIIADDHGILRAGLSAILSAESEIEVVGDASDAVEVLQQVADLQPDIVLMDISMPGLDGLQATRLIREQHPNIKVLILTVHEDKAVLQGALQAGASGYLLKRAAKSELLNAIHSLMRGDLYVHSSLTRALLGDGTPTSSQAQPAKEESKEPLTKRELEVLRLIVQGYTNGQMAEQLSISARTVEYHRANIMDKLNVKSRVGLVRYAADHGLLHND